MSRVTFDPVAFKSHSRMLGDKQHVLSHCDVEGKILPICIFPR